MGDPAPKALAPKQVRLATITNCRNCPHHGTKLTKGYGYATDYFCTAANNQMIKGYVEWEGEAPQDGEFPAFCPLAKVDL